MKNVTQKKILILVILLLCSISFNFVFAVSSGAPEPGSDQDPLVSKSYVDTCIQKLQTENTEIKKLLANQNSSGNSSFEAISLEAGQVMYTGAGTEIVLRTGKASAVKGPQGGVLCDVTSAKDLANGIVLNTNHLLISSRDDGRGIKANSKCWLIIRGSYHLEEPAKESDVIQQEKPKISGTVIASLLNVRAQSNTKTNILAKLKKGDSVDVLMKKESWYQITTKEGIVGWVTAEYLVVN